MNARFPALFARAGNRHTTVQGGQINTLESIILAYMAAVLATISYLTYALLIDEDVMKYFFSLRPCSMQLDFPSAEAIAQAGVAKICIEVTKGGNTDSYDPYPG